jgi:tetratricopeptide (TPR) repeat protein
MMVGTTVSHYEIRAKLGGGGMGVVYRAEDTKLHRTVALKFLPPEMTRDEEAKERFVQEAQAASALDHPNICTVHDIDETDDGRLFICMACYDGETAKEMLQRGPLPLDVAVDVAIDAGKGLLAAHEQGIVHRDIKPANIFITREGRAKLLDFGLAKLSGQTRLTQAGRIVGTAAYMSPEQARGKVVDCRTDLWSLGATFYHLVTGRLPFEADHPQAALYAICHEDPLPVAALRPDAPEALGAIIERCLTKDPAERYASAKELVTDLVRLRPSLEPGAAGLLTATTLPVSQRRSLRPGMIGAVAAVVLAGSFLVHPSGRDAVGRWLAGRATDRDQITATASIPAERHVALLPIKSSDESDLLLAEGLTEYLTFRLSQVEQADPSFWILPSAEVREHDVPTPALVRAASGATLALAGRIDREGPVYRLAMDLVDTGTGEVIESWDTTARRRDATALQHETVLRLVEALGIDLEPLVLRALVAGATTSSDACEAYLRGLGAFEVAATDGDATIDDALSFMRRAVEQDPSYALAHAALGRILWSKCQEAKEPWYETEAVASLERAIELESGLAAPHVTLAEIHAAAGRHEEAIGELRLALAVDPANDRAHTDLARSFTALGRIEDAERTYEEAIDLQPGYWVPIRDLAVFYRTLGEYEKAEAEFRRVIALVPDNAWGYNALAVVCCDTDRTDEACELLEQANEITPSYAGYSNLGTIYFVGGRYEDAARIYEVALALDDSHYDVWGNLGSSYLWVPGCHEKALAAYREAVKRAEEQRRVRPNDGDLLCFLAGYYAELGESDKARTLTARALELAPDDVVVMFQAGHTYEVLGDRDRALEWIGEALEHGYSLEQVETTPALAELRKDERYRRLIERTGVTS